MWMVAECRPLLRSSDKDRLAPQVSSAREGAGREARGDARTSRLTNFS